MNHVVSRAAIKAIQRFSGAGETAEQISVRLQIDPARVADFMPKPKKAKPKKAEAPPDPDDGE